MMLKKRISVLRIIAFLGTALLPLALLGLGFIFAIGGTILNIAFTMGYMILPLCALIALLFLIFSNIVVGKKVALCFAVLFLLIVTFTMVNIGGTFILLDHYEDENVAEPYAEVANAFDHMPKLSEIGSPEQIEYYDMFSSLGLISIFTSDTDILICQYGEDDYQNQKALLDETYVFQTAPMNSGKENIEPTAEIDGYVFRMLSVSGEYEKSYYFPNRLIFIATNDATKEIVYLSFFDDDLDYIGSMTTFINEKCGWEHIR